MRSSVQCLLKPKVVPGTKMSAKKRTIGQFYCSKDKNPNHLNKTWMSVNLRSQTAITRDPGDKGQINNLKTLMSGIEQQKDKNKKRFSKIVID